MEFDASTAEPVAAAVEPQFDPESAAPVSSGGKTQKEPSNPFALNEKEFTAASPLGRLKMMLSHPWDKYVASVDQGFKGPEIPRVEADRGGGAVARAGQVGAALDNTVAGAASGIISPGGVTAILNPATIVYSAPRFAAGGVEHIIDAVKGVISGEDTVQQTVEKGVGGALMLAGGVHGVKSGLRAASVPKTPEQAIELIRTEADKTTDPTARAALEGAAEKISATAQKGVAFDPSTAEPLNPVTREEINTADQKLKDEFAARNQPAATEGPTVGDLGAYAKFGGFKIQPVGDGVWDIRIEGDPTPKIYTREQLQGAGWAVDKLPEATPEVKKAGPQKIADIQTALADQDTVPQLSVWPRDAVPEGKSRLLQVDFPSPNAKGAAGDGNYSSASPALLREMGVDIPEPPEWLPAGSYTIEQVREAIKSGPPAATAEVGLGAASPKEFKPVEEFTTSIKNSLVDKESIARGEPALMREAAKDFGSVWDEAMKRVDENQNAADELISELRDSPRPAKDFENAILLHRKIDLTNEFNRAERNLRENIGTPDSLAADRATKQRVLDELLGLNKVTRSTGIEQSAALNTRKLLAKQDFSLASMLTKRSAAKGDVKLTPEEISEVESVHKKIADAEKESASNPSPRSEAKLEKAQAEFDDLLEKDRTKQLTGLQRLKEESLGVYDAARNLMTTGELSFLLRQGKIAAASHPIMTARALPKTFQALFGDEITARAIDIETKNDPIAQQAIENGVHFAEEGAKLSQREETIASKLADKIPVLRNFNQAGRVFLNKVRLDLYKAMAGDTKLTAEQGEALAKYVNEATGRGSLGGLEKSAVTLGRILFAPRYLSSRIQYLTGHSMWGGDLATRRIIAKEYAKTLVGLGVYYTSLLAAFNALNEDKKKAPVLTLDPRSTDFGKVKLGDTRLDPLAGLSQVIVFGARTASGEKANAAGKIVPIRGNVPYGGQKWSDVAATFARSKLHPIPGAIINLFDGTDLAGNKVTPLSQAENMVSPLTYVDIYQALEEQDLPEGVALSLLALLGEGLQTYNNQKPKKQMGHPPPMLKK